MNTENVKQLIKNLRRGDDLQQSKQQFFAEMRTNFRYWSQTLTLRWLVSVIDSFIDHGTETERRNAAIVSTYFNLVKIADTRLLLTVDNAILLPRLQQDVMFMYDEVNSLKITSDDMPNILFYRLNELLQTTPHINCLFEEIKKRLAHHSPTMQVAQYHKGFYDKVFFENRKHFKQC